MVVQRMGLLFRLLKILLFIVLLSVSSFAAQDDLQVIISIDALHPDALTEKNAPNIWQAAQKGAVALNGESTTPPKTLIAHTAMLTGLTPDESGKKDNAWAPGQPRVNEDTGAQTLFDRMKALGYATTYIYSKEKLGYLAGNGVDTEVFAPDDAIAQARAAVAKGGRQFVVLHISGLDFEGPISGWMSAGYLEEFLFIDEDLAPLLQEIMNHENYTLIITSDHAGHERIHGSNHPEDKKRPIVLIRSFGNAEIAADALSVEKVGSLLAPQ